MAMMESLTNDAQIQIWMNQIVEDVRKETYRIICKAAENNMAVATLIGKKSYGSHYYFQDVEETAEHVQACVSTGIYLNEKTKTLCILECQENGIPTMIVDVPVVKIISFPDQDGCFKYQRLQDGEHVEVTGKIF